MLEYIPDDNRGLRRCQAATWAQPNIGEASESSNSKTRRADAHGGCTARVAWLCRYWSMAEVFAALLYDAGLQQLPNRENVPRLHRGRSSERKCSGSDKRFAGRFSDDASETRDALGSVLLLFPAAQRYLFEICQARNPRRRR